MMHRLLSLARALLFAIGATLGVDAFAVETLDKETLDVRNADCLSCHAKEMPGIYNQWRHSRHAEVGVGCIECHAAAKEELDAFEHHDEWIATLVTPKDCGGCHLRITQEVQRSHHATAGQILESADSFLANAAGGHPVASYPAWCSPCLHRLRRR